MSKTEDTARLTLKRLGVLIGNCTPESQPSKELLEGFITLFKFLRDETVEEKLLKRLGAVESLTQRLTTKDSVQGAWMGKVKT